MYKQILAIVLLSALIMLTASYCARALQSVLDAHDYIQQLLAYVFSSGKIGSFIAQLISYLVLPFLVAGVAAGVYGMVRKKFLPWFMCLVWTCWLVQTTAFILYS